MSDVSPTRIDPSLAKTATRLARVGLAGLVLLPPLLWSAAIVMVEQHKAIGQDAPNSHWLGLDMFEWWSISAVALTSVAITLSLWVFVIQRPVHALHKAERRMRVLDKRDALTGLPNRAGLNLALELALARWRGTTRKVGVLVLDVDRFRLVNDSLGAGAGDQLLRSVASRIRALVRDADVVARIGADQFAVQVAGITGVAALDVMARNLLRTFEAAHDLGGHATVTSLSIGVAVQAETAETADGADALLQCAELAMREAKAAGGSCSRVFDASMRVGDNRRLELDQQLRRALREGEFVLVYQPIMDASGERIVATEALLRWADPQRGMMSPAEFIPVLEQTGLIVEVGGWVLRDACRQGAKWFARGARSLVVSVNVSPRQFADTGFLASVKSTLTETRFPGHLLQLEVTEGLLLDPSPETLRKIGELVVCGVRFAIDDFGMGYSSLAYLKTFPLQTLKIDRMFVKDIALQPRDAAIARAIVDLGHGLGMKVTAEGVETAEQFALLRSLGCDSLQGYLFSRPLPVAQMQELLDRPDAPDPDPEARPGETHREPGLIIPA